ncbi:MAG: class I adenylate-forming enzyme family protein [Gemmatimonadales bacterium]
MSEPRASWPAFPRFNDPLRHWRNLAPDRIALVDRGSGTRYSYAALDALCDKWAALLETAGVERGDRAAVVAGNRVEIVALFFACTRLGAALVPVNWRLAPQELSAILLHAKAKLLIGESRFQESTGIAGEHGARWIDLDADAPRLLDKATRRSADVELNPGDPALILYTSGSTGQPKGVIVPQRQILFNAVATTTAWELTHADIAPVATPFFHTGGWNVFATPLWHRGGTVVLFDQFDPATFLDALAEERCTVALTIPTQLVMMRESAGWGRPLPDLRFFIAGGAPCPPSLAAKVREAGYTLREGYGLTECGPNCFAISSEESLRNPGRVGRPVPFLEMRLVSEDGLDVPDDEPGELLLRGPQMFGGYLHDPERTKEALAPGGWLRTGDLAIRGEDGLYSICGRRKEMYISGGENVFPGEVESALTAHPAIAEAVVVGVPHSVWGEVGCAFVLLRDAGAGTPTAEDIIAFARRSLAGYKVPRRVIVASELPRLGSGKPDRRALAADAPAAEPQHVSA